ncbi:MAG: hypothetical protein KHX14_07855 [[Clostridium] spiroforme]|uniref:Septum formation initiator n=1 Tax=Thomasclavelia spiroformis TaxID=29348 RepID=A0A943EQM2_9FIRM|nr:hypothetical protein [Thomasclavelia spiroformis]MBS5588710.1 hypothetical protein [Thomasclavelia spiroformis]
MMLKAKRLIVSVVSLSLLINILSFVYIAQIKNNQEALNKSYQSQIVELEEKNERLKENNDTLLDDNIFFKEQYQKYFELSEELQNQIGVYSN